VPKWNVPLSVPAPDADDPEVRDENLANAPPVGCVADAPSNPIALVPSKTVSGVQKKAIAFNDLHSNV